MKRQLNRKLQYFFSSQRRGRDGIHEILNQLNTTGEIVLIGGMIRDLTLFGNAKFFLSHSDLDFVIEPKDIDAFEEHMVLIGAKTNRFGGYSLPPKNGWKVDIWPLKKTWAHLEGHVNVQKLEDVTKVTFFDCDAIIYNLTERKLYYIENYFDNLKDRILDINLISNPNPIGNAVRAFRYALLKGFVWRYKLAVFVVEIIDTVGWDVLVEKEIQSYRDSCIKSIDKLKFEQLLRSYISVSEQTVFSLKF
jgi:hypothetical protein